MEKSENRCIFIIGIVSLVHAVANARRCTDFTPLKSKNRGGKTLYMICACTDTLCHFFSARNTVELLLSIEESSPTVNRNRLQFKVAGELHQTIIIDLSLGRIGKKKSE